MFSFQNEADGVNDSSNEGAGQFGLGVVGVEGEKYISLLDIQNKDRDNEVRGLKMGQKKTITT